MQAAKVVGRVGGWSNYLLMMARGIFQSFWAVLYGKTPLEVAQGVPRFLPDQVYLLLGGVCLTAAGGMLRLSFRRRVEFTETQLFVIWILCATIGPVGLSFFAFILKYFQM